MARLKLVPPSNLVMCAESCCIFFFYRSSLCCYSGFWCEKTAGAAHCLMSSAASERRIIVKAPSITAPPCGLCLNQQPGSLSTVEMVPWVRIILSKSYFRQYFMPLLLISFLHTQKGSDGIFLPYFHLALSVSLPFLFSLVPSALADRLAFFISPPSQHQPFSILLVLLQKNPPLSFSPTHPFLPKLSLYAPLPHPLVSLGSLKGRRGQS